MPGSWNIRACIPPAAEAFLTKSRTPQARRSPGQLCSALRVRKPQAATASIPFRGAIDLYVFARGFSFRQPVPPLIRRLWAAPSPEGKVFVKKSSRPGGRELGGMKKEIYFFSASSTATATETVAPTMGLLPMPRKPIISTWAGTEEEPANWASECIRPMVSVMP